MNARVTRKKLYFETEMLSPFIPEVTQLQFLPRKKKKALKKQIAIKFVELLEEFVKTGEIKSIEL